MCKCLLLPFLVLGLFLAACGGPASPDQPAQESGYEEGQVLISATDPPSPTLTAESSPELEVESPELIGPAPRTAGTMYYDPLLGQVILASGYSCENTWSYNDMDLDDVWAFNVEELAWESLGELDVPNPYNIGYDAESERVIFLTFNPIETWAYDPVSGEAQNMEPEEMPPDTLLSFYLFGAPLAYDSESDRLILFGGGEQPGIMHADTWAYDYNTNTWTNMQPESAPPERAFHSLVYDAESDRVILWGGDQAGGDDKMIWAYDYNSNTWQGLENTNGPASHWERFGMVYHPPSDRVIIYTGFLAAYGPQEETFFEPATWTYDYNKNTWQEIVTETNPGQRTMYSMAYDEKADKVILFSGEPTSKYANDMISDVWLFDPAAQEWTDVSKEYVGCPE